MISHELMSKRDPLPYEKYDNDDNFQGSRFRQGKAYKVPDHVAQQQEPWSRLSAVHTLQSLRRTYNHHDPKAPNDALDFELKTQYNQHGDLFSDKNITLYQKETMGLDHGRILKNREKPATLAHPPDYPPLIISPEGARMSTHSIKGAIRGVHTEITNPGYSRKTDGGFFTT